MDLDKSMSSDDEREEEVSPGKSKEFLKILSDFKKRECKESKWRFGVYEKDNETRWAEKFRKWLFWFPRKNQLYSWRTRRNLFSSYGCHQSNFFVKNIFLTIFKKEDARLLTAESELISNVQGIGVVDYDIDSYVQRLEGVIKQKLQMYSLLDKKLAKFKYYLIIII